MELIAIINVTFQLWFLNYFLQDTPRANGIFTLTWFFKDPSLRKDELIKLFPRISNCHMQYLSHTGRIIDIHAICVLQYNGLNEAMYLIIFAWLLILFLITTISMIMITIVAMIPKFRIATAAVGLNDRSRKCLSKFLTKNGIGGWYELLLLRKNESTLLIQEFLEVATCED